MDKRRLSAILLMASFHVLVLGSVFTPPRLYQETNIGLRMQIVEDHQLQFTMAQITSILASTGLAMGYLILALQLQKTARAGWATLGAITMILGTIALGAYNLMTLSDPRTFLDRALRERTSLAFVVDFYAWFTIAGYLFYRIVFLRGGFPRWLAYATITVAILALIAVIYIDTFAVEALFLMPLIIGITLLRQAGKPKKSSVAVQ